MCPRLQAWRERCSFGDGLHEADANSPATLVRVCRTTKGRPPDKVLLWHRLGFESSAAVRRRRDGSHLFAEDDALAARFDDPSVKLHAKQEIERVRLYSEQIGTVEASLLAGVQERGAAAHRPRGRSQAYGIRRTDRQRLQVITWRAQAITGVDAQLGEDHALIATNWEGG